MVLGVPILKHFRVLTICIDPAIDLPLQSPALNIRKHTKAEKNFSETQTKIQAVSDFLLTHSYLETPKRVIGKQCRPRSDAT